MQNRTVKIYPNKKTQNQWVQHLFQLTGVYNWAIKKAQTTLDLNFSWKTNINLLKEKILRNYLLDQITDHSKRCELSSKAIAGAITDAVDAKSRFLNKQNKKPKLKSKRNKLNSIYFTGDCDIRISPPRHSIRQNTPM